MTEDQGGGLSVPRANALDQLKLAGFSASLGLIPYFGPAASEFVTAGLSIKARIRDEEFFEEVARRIRNLESKVNGLTAADVFDDDRFNAYAHRIVRAARETADSGKRELLAAALANSGPWSGVPDDELARYTELVLRYSEVHVRLLDFFDDPEGWLRRGSNSWVGNTVVMGSISTVLSEHVFDGASMAAASRALSELDRDGLLQNPGLSTIMTGNGVLAARTTGDGKRFLEWIRNSSEPDK